MKNIEKILLNKHIRPTAMRLLILEYLTKQSSTTALAELETAFDHSDRITIYRTLKTFEEKGVIHKVIDDSGVAKFGLCSPYCDENRHRDMHVHFNCSVCHETFCLPSSKIQLPYLPGNFTAEEVNLIVKGICPKCNC